ncbi:MAG TPA: thioredoxin domain-containing protein [Anaerolineales bacterium]|nr:thioredoxin domain-containing protein [Anaerolineales bacterium]HMV95068.1 thioredoxin domain-containing protein [Anaerolineales bacterium]HMX18693.1 thioredoxin domain-containing protein [Anaerolineales bacterium]HMX72880.1 thioredoxin domain-containing protein [Anaerolineales bacterium]HMZ42374.1 thioredoxin domain-containing protein [Anaerolineales bacterium]
MNNPKELSKRQARREQIRRQSQRQRFIGIGLVVLGALAVAFLIIWPNLKPITGIISVEPNPRPQADANNMGDPNAPVKLVEYSDYQCPFCERFASETEAKLVEAYVSTGKLYFTYRSAGNWVSDNIRGGKTESEDAAKAAYCAGDQNLYWEMHDMLFANVLGEDVDSFTDRRLAAIAEQTGVDMTQFNECYSSGKFDDQVFQDGKDALTAGVRGTPGFVLSYVNASGEEVTQLIEGAQPFDVFAQAIDAALAAAGQ